MNIVLLYVRRLARQDSLLPYELIYQMKRLMSLPLWHATSAAVGSWYRFLVLQTRFLFSRYCNYLHAQFVSFLIVSGWEQCPLISVWAHKASCCNSCIVAAYQVVSSCWKCVLVGYWIFLSYTTFCITGCSVYFSSTYWYDFNSRGSIAL